MPVIFKSRRQSIRPPNPKKMKDKYAITFDLINQAVELDAETGLLYWKEWPVERFYSEAMAC